MQPNLILAGKTAVVTGASSGIGLHSMIALVKAGAFSIGIGRDPQRCQNAEEQVKSVCPDGNVRYIVADLSRQAEIHRLTREIQDALLASNYPALDVLVNNAGAYSGKRVYTEDGVELMLAVNHLAPFLLTHLLLPSLKISPTGRIVTISSGSHYKTSISLPRLNNPLIYFGLDRYKITKLANVLFTYELNRRLADSSIRAFAVEPGLVNTDMGQKGTGRLASFVWKHRKKKGRSPDVPAQTVLFLSSEPSLQKSKDYYWRDCLPKKPDPQAEREDLARALWEISTQLCHLRDKD
jgi:NAD(P)-dependent dehydrogenase (short-subunit alcohol dehydrogenase family)